MVTITIYWRSGRTSVVRRSPAFAAKVLTQNTQGTRPGIVLVEVDTGGMAEAGIAATIDCTWDSGDWDAEWCYLLDLDANTLTVKGSRYHGPVAVTWPLDALPDNDAMLALEDEEADDEDITEMEP